MQPIKTFFDLMCNKISSDCGETKKFCIQDEHHDYWEIDFVPSENTEFRRFTISAGEEKINYEIVENASPYFTIVDEKDNKQKVQIYSI